MFIQVQKLHNLSYNVINYSPSVSTKVAFLVQFINYFQNISQAVWRHIVQRRSKKAARQKDHISAQLAPLEYRKRTVRFTNRRVS